MVASQAAEQVVPLLEKKVRAVQYVLAKWFGTSSQNDASAPILPYVDFGQEESGHKEESPGEAVRESQAALADGIAARAAFLAVEATKLTHGWKAYGRLGGRPEMPLLDRRGVAGGDCSNRLAAGQERRRL